MWKGFLFLIIIIIVVIGYKALKNSLAEDKLQGLLDSAKSKVKQQKTINETNKVLKKADKLKEKK